MKITNEEGMPNLPEAQAIFHKWTLLYTVKNTSKQQFAVVTIYLSGKILARSLQNPLNQNLS